jgi:type VI secretion system protein ImpF
MPVRDGRIPMVASVLDRLTDSSYSGTLGANRPGTLATLRESVLRDLEYLLNTRREERLIPVGYPECSSSLLNYGLADLTQYSLKNPSEQDRLRRAIGSAIAALEPRLTQVAVVVERWDGAKPLLRFRVEAMLRNEAAPEPVVFDTEYSLENGRFMLRGRRR